MNESPGIPNDTKDNPSIVNQLVFKTQPKEQQIHEIIAVLMKAEKCQKDYNVITKPPIRPPAGSIFLYKKNSTEDTGFVDDQYTGFRFKARKTIAKTFVKTYYKMELREDNSTKRVPVNFSKNTYWLCNSINKDQQIVMIHYFGDEKLWVPQSHGNSKSNRPYVRTGARAKQEIKAKVQDRENQPKKVYEKLVREASKPTLERTKEEAIAYEPIIAPRDLEQVKNFKKAVARENKISKCEIFSVYDLATSELSNFVSKMELIPFDIIIFGEPVLLKLASQLLQFSNNNEELPQLLGYDTTFNLADSFVSTLVMKNVLCHGNPIFPVAFMIHDRKVTDVHQAFWTTMSKFLDLSFLCDKVPFCADREPAIMKAIKSVIPRGNLISCTNHIKQDLKFWLRNTIGSKQDDHVILQQQINSLLEAGNAVEYDDLLESFQSKWSEEFTNYFNKNLRNDVRGSANFNVRRYAAFVDSLPTNNISESLNFAIKSQNDWKELPIDVLVLKLIAMQCMYLSEFIRANRSLGKYKLKDEFKNIWNPDPPFYLHFSESEFVKCIKQSTAAEELLRPDQNLSKEILAKRCLELKLVGHFPEQQLFVVRSPYTSITYHVTRGLIGKVAKREFVCSCKSLLICYHILAVKMSIGDSVYDEAGTRKLSVIKKKARGVKGRFGRKKPNIQDLIANVEEADDSELAKKKRKIETEEGGENENLPFFMETDPAPGPNDFDQKSNAVNASILTQNHEDSQDERDIMELPDFFEEAFMKEQHATVPVKWLKKYPTLTVDTWIEGSVIDAVILEVLKTGSVQSVMHVDECIYQTVWKKGKLNHIANFSHLRGGLNKDLVFVCVTTGSHWMLGTIILESKTICLFDSLQHQTKPDLRIPCFESLFMIVQGIYAAAGMEASKEEFKFYYASDSPRQEDGTECGVIVCLMIYAFIRQLPFPSYKSTLCSKYHMRNRNWMLATLASRTAEKPKFENRRLPPIQKKIIEAIIPIANVTNSEIVVTECAEFVLRALEENKKPRIFCKLCGGCQPVENDKVILCVICREKFHFTCLNIGGAKLPTYYKCQNCI